MNFIADTGRFRDGIDRSEFHCEELGGILVLFSLDMDHLTSYWDGVLPEVAFCLHDMKNEPAMQHNFSPPVKDQRVCRSG